MRIFFLLALPIFLCAAFSEEQCARRVYAHLLLKDTGSAVEEAKRALHAFPTSESLHLAYLRALCEKGEEMQALEAWRNLGAKKERQYLEYLGWGVLSKGERSDQLPIRAMSLLGAAFTRDAKALPLLIKELRGSNALLRSLAVRLAAMYGDASLREEIARLLKEEKVWYVRLEVIRAAGQLRMVEQRDLLKEIVGHPKTLAEEKAAATVALVNMYEVIDLQELRHLSKSSRAGLRELACEIVAHLDFKEGSKEIVYLLRDNSPDVRMAALSALGMMGKEVAFTSFAHCLEDSSPPVAITAAWLAMLQGKEEGKETLRFWLHSSHPEWRRLASGALAATGMGGNGFAYQVMKDNKDIYVKATLALSLIGHRKQVKEACQTLLSLFKAEKDTLWMWDNSHNSIFRFLSPSRLHHIEQIPHYPKVVDQLVRLELLSVLCIMRYPGSLEVVKGFLQNQHWGVTGNAAATLLEEGDEEALEIVRQLLSDRDGNVRLQAALILAMVGSDPAALKELEQAYKQVDREKKIHILEAIGHIGDPSSIPFLLEILSEPFQALRVVAASALIQTLYH